MEDLLKALVQAPISVWLVFAGVLFLLFSALEVREESDKKGVKNRSVKPRQPVFWLGIVLGGLLLLGGIWLSQAQASQLGSTPAPQPSTETLPPPTVPPSFTATRPSSTEMPSPQPGSTESLSSPSPAPLSLKDACIAADRWVLVSTQPGAAAPFPDGRGCLDVSEAGITVNKQGVLAFKISQTAQIYLAAIALPVEAIAEVEFDLQRSALQAAYANELAAIEVAIAPAKEPTSNDDAARFRLMRDSLSDPLTYFWLADLGETKGAKISALHYEKSGGYHIRLSLDGSTLKVYIDGAAMPKTLRLPPGPKVLRLGYLAARNATIDAQISNLTVNGLTP